MESTKEEKKTKEKTQTKSNEIVNNNKNENSNKGENEESKTNVTAWDVVGKIDYMELVKKFGTELIDETVLEKFKKVTGKDLHPWLSRGIFFSHRGLNQFLDSYANGDPVFLYTGRGPTSDAMHIGHLIPFMFTKYLQDIFDCPLVIQIADEEKAAFKKTKFEHIYRMGFENAKEIISCGFNPEKTFIFSNRDHRTKCVPYENFVSEMKMGVSLKEIQKIFGLGDEATIAMYDWPLYQAAAGFSQSYPHIFDGRPSYCLVPHAIDQDPYFRLGRDVASRMGILKTCSIMCTFIDPLTGKGGKMSSSVGTDATLFLNDKAEITRQKIMKHSFSGGGGDGTLEQHKKFGGNPDVDIAYQYLRYFESSDQELKRIHDAFKSGEMSCGEIKKIMAEKIIAKIEEVQTNRAKVTDEILKDFYSYKKMKLPEPKKKEPTEAELKVYEALDKLGIKYRVKYHSPITTFDEANELASSLQGSTVKFEFYKGQGEIYYFYLIDSKTSVNKDKFHLKLNIKKIRHGENDTFELITGVKKNFATVFALSNDINKKLTIVVDESIDKDTPVNFLAMRPDATVTLDYIDMLKYIESLGYTTIHVKSE